jgi:transposase
MKHRSKDFKEHILKLYHSRIFKVSELLKIGNISNGTLYNWIKSYNLLRKPINRKSKITCEIRCYIFSTIMKNNTFNWRYLIKSVNLKFKTKISKSYLYLIIKKLNLTKKKCRKRNIFKSKDKWMNDEKNFKKRISKCKIDDIISIDETSIDTLITNNYGWNIKGKRILKKNFNVKRIRWTLICGISNRKIVSKMLIKGSAKKENFNEFMKGLPKNKNYLMDNARIHHNKDLKLMFKNRIIYNVPYSPETNPIEMFFSELKSNLRKELLINEKTIIKCINKCNNKNLNKYFHHSLSDLC